ncbi:hypothetical protein JCM33374_g1210 [Metschnikowia sp. JCM 33374]|nr:hypothetical protein JCM33374_g1210 [Metschnikowia sp. JCM 33374]
MMMLYSLLTILGLISLGFAQAAPRSRDSPRGAVYRAIFSRGITGSLTFSSRNGYVAVNVNLAGLPRTGGPFMYHIHEKRVAFTGDCASTMGHFNPYNGVLNAKTLAMFEVGDLSGKYGTIPGTTYRRNYVDQYLSLNPRNRAFFGDLSVVVHLNDGTRIACANIYRVGAPVPLNAEDSNGGNEGPAELVGTYSTDLNDVATENVAELSNETGMPEELGADSREQIADEAVDNDTAQVTEAPAQPEESAQPEDLNVGPFSTSTEVSQT